MTIAKATILATGFVAAFALGVAVGPSMTGALHHDQQTQITQPAQAGAENTPAPATRTRATTPRAPAPRAKSSTAASELPASSAGMSVSEPRLHERLKPVLNRGARMDAAAEGFRSAEEFATVAHAARNTSVPFMLLKHRVLDEGKSLTDAIHEAKPDVDAKLEVKRAQAAAKSDIEALAG